MSKQDIQERKFYQKRIDELWLCVLGNGHPEEGMKWKLEQLFQFTAVVKKLIWIGATGAISAILLLAYTVFKDQVLRGNI